MQIRRILQPLAALAVGVVVVAVTALPGGASTGTVSGGTLTVSTLPTPVSVDLDPAAGPCPGLSVSWLDLVATELVVFAHPFTHGGTTYFLGLYGPTQVLLSAGTMTVGPITGPVMNILPETSPGSCVADWAAPRCTTMGLASPGLSLTGPWTGGSATLSGSRTVTSSGCGAPFTGMNGRTLTITDLVVDF